MNETLDFLLANYADVLIISLVMLLACLVIWLPDLIKEEREWKRMEREIEMEERAARKKHLNVAEK